MGHPLLRAVLLSLFIYISAPALAQDAQELRIVRITPEGEDVTATRQIVLEFNRPVVAVGDMARTAEEVGITITPEVKCEWRWLNTTSLSCNLDEKESLEQATKYSLRVEPKIAAEDGAMIAAAQDHSFITQRPSVSDASVRTWKGPGTPVYRLGFTQPVTQSSVADHIYFENLVRKERYDVDVTKDENDESEAIKKDGVDARQIWVVQPKEDMPGDTNILLKQEAGLIPATGNEASVEEREIKSFYTFPEFKFRGLACRNLKGNDIILAPDTPPDTDTLCDPMLPASLVFNVPVLRSQIADNMKITPDLAGGRKDYNPWGDENRDWSRLYEEHADQFTEYRIGLPVGLKAAQKYTFAVEQKKKTVWQWIQSLFGKEFPAETKLVDEFGRPLAPFTLSFATDHRKPNYEMVYKDAVLEKGIDSDVPVYVNNLQDFSFNYTKLDANGKTSATTDLTKVPEVQDIQFAMPTGIRSLLGDKSGAVLAYLDTAPVVEKWDGANRLFAQVTPYQIYAKLGHFQSAIWVTDLKTGLPVTNAKITLYRDALANLSAPSDIIATAQSDENGLVIFPGTTEFDPALKLNRAYKDEDERLFVRVDKDGDMALLPIGYDYEVQLWNVATDLYNNSLEKYGHMKSWGMTAQGVYRAGDTMQYKIYVRDQDNNRFVVPPSGKYTIDITDPTGKSVERVEGVSVSEFGTIAGEYAIPKTAPVGWYQFKLEAALKVDGKDITKEFYPLSVLVSDFTPAPFRVTTELNGDRFKAGDKLDITAEAKLHSGGAYGEAAIRNTITLRARAFTTKDPAAQGYWFNSHETEEEREDLQQKEEKLNDKGEWKESFTLPEKQIVFGQLIVESAVRDDRGKSVASEARADYLGVDRLVGLKPTEWVYESGKPAIIKAIVVDDTGKPVEGVAIESVIEREDVVTAKVKGAGNAYLGDNTVEWKKTADCSNKSGLEGQDCTFTPSTAGTYRITSTIKDTKGRTHTSQQTLWVTGSDYVQWNDSKEYALTIMPEKNEYKVGEKARYLVKNPWPGVTALVTVERYGVIDSFVQKLEGSAPVIEIPVKPDYAPGFYVSIVAMSPRVDAPPPELGQIDMGKPAFRVGYVKTDVSDLYKEMEVTAKAAQDVYRPREKVKVSLDVKPRNADADKKEPVELAVAVLDESVFDLIADGKNAFDPYHGFYDLEALDVSNYSLLSRLIGRQKFEKKGANPGGDGGIDAGMRNIFKFVSYWNPSVPVTNGKAEIEFEAPDNLTGWRVLALATTPNDLMGLGEANFKVNRPTEIRPVMPNQVREGDEFNAGFSVMNRSDKARTIKVTVTATGDVQDVEKASKVETLTIEPYKRATVLLPLKTSLIPVTRDVVEGKIVFSVTAGDETDSDGLEHTLPLYKSRTIQTAATYGTTTEEAAHENIAVPKDIYTDSGDISVTLSPSVISGLDGAFKYMRDYPYPCWEQKLTMAVMASQYVALKPYLDEKTEWKDANVLTQEILQNAASYQAPNGGMAYYIGQDQYVDPYLSSYTALAFTWLRAAGHKIPENVEANLQKYLLGFLRNNAKPDYYQDGMTSTVRAVILAALKDSGKINKNDILRFRPYVKNMSLFGKAHYMQAASKFAETKPAAREALGMILSSGVESGGKFSFNETYDAGYERILATPLRDNCAVLDAIIKYDDEELVGDKPFKLVRMITQSRGNRDHFENTQENMFCMTALSSYAKKYESEEPDMKVVSLFKDKAIGVASFQDVKDKPVTLSRPLEESDVGTTGKLTMARDGDGRLYYTARLRYAAKDIKDSVNAGMDIRREYSVKKDGKWTIAPSPLSIKRGDLVKVDLYLSIPTARNFVVVNDPLPGGLETVNRDLATASKNDADQSLFDESGGSYWYKFTDWKEYASTRWSFYHQELRHDSARFYSDWLEPGNYHLSYTAQAVATGTFDAPPVKAEEMYDPDVYGIGVKEELRVEETP